MQSDSAAESHIGSPQQDTEKKYLTVTETLQLMSNCLEKNLPNIMLQGEISEVVRAASGHVYLTLKDANGSVSAVIWRGVASTLKIEIKAGLAILCLAKPTIYSKNGRLQLVLTRVVASGEGLLRQRFLELKAKLEKEGLFDPARKRQLPFLPKAIGIVTSSTGAVIHDMMVRFKARAPSIPIYLIDVRVQGPGAAEEIAAAVRDFNRWGQIDLLIVGRGGGSLEDLWAFNEEVVVRAIFGSRIPVVSAVGHEVDVTLADFVADRRAPTPTAAAELVTPEISKILQRIVELETRLTDYNRYLAPFAQWLDELTIRLGAATEGLLTRARSKLSNIEVRLSPTALNRVVTQSQKDIDGYATRLRLAITQLGDRAELRLRGLAQKLEAMNPNAVLSRGYSVVLSERGVIKSVKDISHGELLRVRVSDGEFKTEVK